MTLKKRTLNEIRQEKEFGYTPPTKNTLKTKDNLEIKNLIKKYPNDFELGKAIRMLYQ